jgi:hypothetical protein
MDEIADFQFAGRVVWVERSTKCKKLINKQIIRSNGKKTVNIKTQNLKMG